VTATADLEKVAGPAQGNALGRGLRG